jgi:1-acyl-sn-glycerol-3-phosphate acyltransferase
MARASLFAFKPFGAFIRWLGAIPLARKGADTGPLRNAIETLEAGRGVLIFPEGTRTRDGSVGEFRPGFLFLARRTGSAVVPVAIEGAHEVWPPGRKWPRLGGRIHVSVAEPITPTELESLDDDQAVELVRRRIEELRLVHRDLLRRQSRGRYPPAGPGDQPFWERSAVDERAPQAVTSS